MLKLSGDELPGCFGGMIAADASLRVPLQFIQRGVDRLAVRFPHPVVAANKCGQRDGFRRGKGRIPTCAMFHRRDHIALRVAVFMNNAVLN